MGRAGRKRKSGKRYPGGQLVKADPALRAIDDRVRASRQPHRRDLAEGNLAEHTAARLDARAESPLGRLLLTGRLTRDSEIPDRRTSLDRVSEQAYDRYEAGTMFAQIVGAYRVVIGGPRPTSGSGRGGRECASLCNAAHTMLNAQQRLDVHDGLHSLEACPCLKTKSRYDGCFEALDRRGRAALMAVNRVAVHGQAIEPPQLINLLDGLDALVQHLGLTPRRSTRHYRNTN
jgi:hypothetical protein